jgi:hypothetical protein
MEALERYVADCETKRRRMRDRPSDTVINELRSLLDLVRTTEERRSAPGAESIGSDTGPEGLPRA